MFTPPATLFLLGALALTGCGSTGQSVCDAPAPTVTETQDPSALALEEARTLAASYDYDAALAKLTGATGETMRSFPQEFSTAWITTLL
ncbi:hypothetical protein [Rothia sp. ZJ932]|uniref:hypothetical protein n=1 Tax=Rothia sp. ZJ932 TaxID=2810516 RepID=UPI0019678A37|nr:hypothetical protein [Rothia sp. ZJ932]QRZ61513.1 hypothetical protein JR346_09920 [Rothia sp. ZJ932]